MKKMFILIAFCSLTLSGCASYSVYSRACRNLDVILIDKINRIDPIIDSMDESIFSAMQSTSKYFSKWE